MCPVLAPQYRMFKPSSHPEVTMAVVNADKPPKSWVPGTPGLVSVWRGTTGRAGPLGPLLWLFTG